MTPAVCLTSNFSPATNWSPHLWTKINNFELRQPAQLCHITTGRGKEANPFEVRQFVQLSKFGVRHFIGQQCDADNSLKNLDFLHSVLAHESPQPFRTTSLFCNNTTPTLDFLNHLLLPVPWPQDRQDDIPKHQRGSRQKQPAPVRLAKSRSSGFGRNRVGVGGGHAVSLPPPHEKVNPGHISADIRCDTPVSRSG